MNKQLVVVEFTKHAAQRYTYRSTLVGLKVGDKVVVMAGKYKVVEVVELIDAPTKRQDEIATKYLVDKIDVTEHKQRVADSKKGK